MSKIPESVKKDLYEYISNLDFKSVPGQFESLISKISKTNGGGPNDTAVPHEVMIESPNTIALAYFGQSISEDAEHFNIIHCKADLKLTECNNDFIRLVLLKKINGYRNYESNWDGYGGNAATKKTIMDALNFIKKLTNISPYIQPGLSNDGEIGLYIQQPNLYVDIGFTGDSKYAYYVNNMNQEYGNDDRLITESIEQRLLEIIQCNNE